MQRTIIDGLVGSQPIQSRWAPDTTPQHPSGLIVTATTPYWGAGEFFYARAEAAIGQFGVCFMTPVYDSTLKEHVFGATEIANVGNTGQALFVAMTSMTVGQYGWFCMSGLVPVGSTASLAPGTIPGVTGPGKIGGVQAGRQLLGARTAFPATTTVARKGQAAGSSFTLRVDSSEGWFMGIYLSGTGIGAGAVVTAIDAAGTTVTMSVATTGAVAGSVTGTYNNGALFYNVIHMNRCFTQGQIT